jgi:hypothetical protein
VKYANQLNLVLALAGIVVLLYTFSATFFSPAPSITIDPVRLRELGAARAGMSTEAEAALQLEATTQTLPVDQARQRRELLQTPRSGEAGTRTSGALVTPSAGQPRSTAGPGNVTGRRSSPAAATPGGPGRVTSLPPRSTTRVFQSGSRLPQGGDTTPGEQGSDSQPQPSGLVGSGGNTKSPGVPPPGVPQPRPGAEIEKRNEPTQPPPPPFRSSMPANRPLQ